MAGTPRRSVTYIRPLLIIRRVHFQFRKRGSAEPEWIVQMWGAMGELVRGLISTVPRFRSRWLRTELTLFT